MANIVESEPDIGGGYTMVRQGATRMRRNFNESAFVFYYMLQKIKLERGHMGLPLPPSYE